jgi:hypothetical protein
MVPWARADTARQESADRESHLVYCGRMVNKVSTACDHGHSEGALLRNPLLSSLGCLGSGIRMFGRQRTRAEPAAGALSRRRDCQNRRAASVR